MSATHPLHPVGLDHVVFLVADMARAVRFYRQVLNCQPGFSYPELGMEQLWFGSALIVLWEVEKSGRGARDKSDRETQNVDHLCLSCGPFERGAVLDHLKELEVEIEREAVHGGARGMGHSIYVFDPDGNKIEIKGPPEHPDLPPSTL